MHRTPFTTTYFFNCLLAFLTVTLISCEEGSPIGLDLQETTNSVEYTDTLTVSVSTVLLDSIVTSGTGTLLLGNYQDAYVSEISSQAYFQVGLGDSWAIDEGTTFDSLQLILPYSTYSYGDTTTRMALQVHQVTEVMEAEALPLYIGTEVPYSYFYTSAGLYNQSNFTVRSQPLVTHSFLPRPGSQDSIVITLPQSMGQEWMRLKMADSRQLNYAEDFAQLIKGLRLSAVGNSSILGVTASGVKLRLYYTASSSATSALYHDFPLITGSTQFNEIKGNFSTSSFQGLANGKTIPSTQTGDVSFAQAGLGAMVKLDFPYLTSLKDLIKTNLINRAVLEIEPVTNTNRYPTPPPQTLTLYQSGVTNVPGSPLLKDYSTTDEQAATYLPDTEFDMNSKYRFTVTDYLTQLLNGTIQNNGLLLAIPSSSFVSTVDKIMVGGPGHSANKVRLRIFYTKINQ